jgi:response regulator NasT
MVDDDSNEKARMAEPPALLVVDDDVIITATLASGLRSVGYCVTGVTSPLQALELCGNKRFNLAIIDQRMPVMSGVELVRRLREAHDLHSIFISAYGSTELADEAAAAGVISYFVKPIDPIALAPAIKAALIRIEDIRAARTRELQLRSALSAERDINTAVGILMERLQLTRSEAFEHLRQYARSQRVQLAKVAGELTLSINASHTLLGEIVSSRQKRRTPPRIDPTGSSDE